MDAEKIMLQISAAAPFALTLLAFATFLSVGIFFVDYYSAVLAFRFGAGAFYFAIFLALIQELTRFALLVSSVRDFGEKRSLNAWLGFIGSIALVYHDVKTANSIAAMYAAQQGAETSATFSGLLIFLVLVGLLLELRLILTIEKKPRLVNAEPITVGKQGKFNFPNKYNSRNGKEMYI